MPGSELHTAISLANTDRWKTDCGRHLRQVNVRKIINILHCCSHSICCWSHLTDHYLRHQGDPIIISFWFPTFQKAAPTRSNVFLVSVHTTHYTISGLIWAETLDRDNTSHSRAEVTGKFNLWHFQPDSMSSGLHLSDRQHVFFSQRIECDLSLFFHTWQRWSLKMIEHQNILNEGRDRSGMGRMAG